MTELVIDYFILVFIAACGVIQMAAAYSKLKGLLFFTKAIYGYVFGAIACIGSFWWFFSVDNRNVPGLEGMEQFEVFNLAWIAAFLFTIVLSSLIKTRTLWDSSSKSSDDAHDSDPDVPAYGLDALKELTYFQIMRHIFKLSDNRRVK